MDIFLPQTSMTLADGQVNNLVKKKLLLMCLLNLNENDFIDLWIGQASLFCQLKNFLIHVVYVKQRLTKYKLCQKRNAKVVNYYKSVYCASFLLNLCTTFSEGHIVLHFQKSFKCDHFLLIFGLVYHTAQNTTLSCSLVKIQESMENKLWISAVSHTLIFQP